jgi:hypothetical protein
MHWAHANSNEFKQQRGVESGSNEEGTSVISQV